LFAQALDFFLPQLLIVLAAAASQPLQLLVPLCDGDDRQESPTGLEHPFLVVGCKLAKAVNVASLPKFTVNPQVVDLAYCLVLAGNQQS
jgi:hypothetical protein